ncbi:asmA protein, assembly of outermembrane proteins [Fulvimarina pelagi HTCC2506]|uniref:AsmA protein, assembly of outermembrane proteins n=1 Tax=Fulvimarina pelagi HTCC2506 TaxID=314231 RepID=Q0G0G0_9HYPH|nr:asmA protein, assembly of outermembrane proteins [Fulvimarina pelagi HTCC2506]
MLIVIVTVMPGFVLASDGARSELVAKMEALTGTPVEISGPISFSVLPRTRLVADRISIGSGVDITIDRIVADFDPVDALFGRATIARIVLVRPEHQPEIIVAEGEADEIGTTVLTVASDISASVERDRNAAQMIAGLEDLARRAIDRLDQLQILEIRNGVWRPGLDEAGPTGISNANLTITRSSSQSAFRMTGGFTWNGQPADIDMRVDSTANLRNGGTSNVSLSFSSPPLTLDFEGIMDFGTLPRLVGRFEGRGDSFATTAAWLANSDYRIPQLGPVSLNGDLTLAGRTLEVTNAELRLAQSSGVGALEYDLDADRLDGTLAFETLDLTPVAEAIVPMPAGPFGFARPIEAEFARSAHLALRVSANQARFGSLDFSDVAAVVTVADGDVSLELGDAGLYGGRAFGRIALSDKSSPWISGELSGFGVDLANLSSTFGGARLRLSGSGEFHASLSTPATDWRTITRSAKTSVSLTAGNGTLSGFDPAVFSEPGTSLLYTGLTGGSLPFETLKAELGTYGPELAIESWSMNNANYRLEARGDAALSSGQLALEGISESLSQTASAGQSQEEFIQPKPIPFTVEGTWPDPRVVTGTSERSRSGDNPIEP